MEGYRGDEEKMEKTMNEKKNTGKRNRSKEVNLK